MTPPPDDQDRDVEADAASALAPHLGDHLRLCQRSFEFISRVLRALPERRLIDTPLACRVGVGLLIKISNDLRTASLLASRGYPVQAATVVSSLYESAVTVAYIRHDEALADDWMQHGTENPLTAFRGIWLMTQAAVAGLALPNSDAMTERLFKTYTQLCWAKHSNSAFLLEQSYTRVGQDLVGGNGPSISEEAVRAGTFALEHGVALVFVAGAVFTQHHIPPEDRSPLVTELNAIGAERERLSGLSHARWGDEDPFPGRWRTVKKPKAP